MPFNYTGELECKPFSDPAESNRNDKGSSKISGSIMMSTTIFPLAHQRSNKQWFFLCVRRIAFVYENTVMWYGSFVLANCTKLASIKGTGDYKNYASTIHAKYRRFVLSYYVAFRQPSSCWLGMFFWQIRIVVFQSRWVAVRVYTKYISIPTN